MRHEYWAGALEEIIDTVAMDGGYDSRMLMASEVVPIGTYSNSIEQATRQVEVGHIEIGRVVGYALVYPVITKLSGGPIIEIHWAVSGIQLVDKPDPETAPY